MNDKLTNEIKARAYTDAYELAKEAARGGHNQPEFVLKKIYETIKEIVQDIENTD